MTDKIKKEFRQKMPGGKDHPTWQGVLDYAHTRDDGPRLAGITTVLLQIPTNDNGNMAISHATVTMADQTTYTGIGDASPNNVGKMVAPHIVRMSETRAKGRALRDAVNIAEALAEEISGTPEEVFASLTLPQQVVESLKGPKADAIKAYIKENHGPISSTTELVNVKPSILEAALAI